MNNKIELIGVVILGIVLIGAIGFTGTGMVTAPAASCPECQECSCEAEEERIESLRETFQDRLEQEIEYQEEKQELAEELFNEYWYCYLAWNCFDRISECDEIFSDVGGYNLEQQEYAEFVCSVAENYETHYEHFAVKEVT